MKESILIGSNGFYLINWDQSTGEQKSKVQIKNQLARYLGAYAEFDEKTTLGTFICLLNDFADEVEYIFNYYLNGVEFNEFFQESLLEPITPPEIDFIDLAWNVRLIISSDLTIIDFIPTLIGVKELPEVDLDEIYDLDFIRLRDMCQFKLCAATAIDIPNSESHEVVVSAERRWTLFEIISGVLQEISKYGNPQDKLEIIEDLKSSSKISFSDLLEYIDDLETNKRDDFPGLTGDDLDEDDDD